MNKNKIVGSFGHAYYFKKTHLINTAHIYYITLLKINNIKAHKSIIRDYRTNLYITIA